MDVADGIFVRRVLSGDRDAFEPLVERYKGMVYAQVVGRTGNFDSAEDIVQATFVEAYRHLKSLKDPAKFRAWVRGIAMNLSREWNRKRKQNVPIEDMDDSRDAAVYDRVLPDTLVELPASPDREYEEKETRDYVLQAVERLPEKYREVVLLHYMEGLKYREIAEMLEVPESTVLGRLQVGRDQLREDLMPIVEETLKERQPTSELTKKVMAALPPMLPVDTGFDLGKCKTVLFEKSVLANRWHSDCSYCWIGDILFRICSHCAVGKRFGFVTEARGDRRRDDNRNR